jgi:hypothetical protein
MLILDGKSRTPRHVLLPTPLMAFATKTSSEGTRRSIEANASVLIEGDKARLRDKYQSRDLAEMVPEPGEAVVASDVAVNGQRWVAASANIVRIGFPGDGRSKVAVLPAGFGDISAVALSPDETLVAVAGSDVLQTSGSSAGMERKQIVLLSSEFGRPIGAAIEMPDPAVTFKVVFSQNSQYFASVSQSNTAVWIAGPALWLRRACAVLEVKITPAEWMRRAPGIGYPETCNSDSATAPLMKLWKQAVN